MMHELIEKTLKVNKWTCLDCQVSRDTVSLTQNICNKVLFDFLCNLPCCGSKPLSAVSVCRNLFHGGSWNLLDGGGRLK